MELNSWPQLAQTVFNLAQLEDERAMVPYFPKLLQQLKLQSGVLEDAIRWRL
jgi:hypothetical protein